MPKVALIQQSSIGDKSSNLQKHKIAIQEAAKQGAQIICLQELFLTDYFCFEENVDHFDLADPIPSITTDILGQIADEYQVVIIASLFEKRAPGIYHNTTVVFDYDGSIAGVHRKMHMPEDPGFQEKFYFTPGDSSYEAINTEYGKIGVLICWDQWYPEAARLMALSGAQIIFYPTAIGWLAEEKAELGQQQHNAWESVQKGHAVANGLFVATTNRVGNENGTEFWGQSFIANPYGQIVSKASHKNDEILIYNVDFDEIEEFRKIWPFFRDRRVDSYENITKRWIDAK